MSLKNHFKKAPKLRPQLNVGSVFDIPNGRYYRGKRGESILNGGIAYFTGVAGKGNTFKSTLMHFFNLKILDRYTSSTSNLYDTEMSLTGERMIQLAQHMDHIAGVDLEMEDRMIITDSTAMMGDEWFSALKAYGDERVKDLKTNRRTAPFIDSETGKSFVTIAPTVVEIDSLSMFITKSVQGIYDKHELGAGGANTDALRSAAVKTQMLMQIPAFTASHGIYIMASAHVGKQHQLDQYAPPAKQLLFLKGQNAFKNVPEKFSFLTNNLFYVHSAEIMQNKNDKTAEFPKGKEDRRSGDTDLQLLTVQNLRAKNGPTGMPFEVIVSQNEGVLMGLTEFNMIRGFDRFGLQGSLQNYQLELYPEVNLSRTTIRGKLEEDALLRRAMEITAELAYMHNVGYRTSDTVDKPTGLNDEEVLETELTCTAKELYEDLKAKGYDWDRLLRTRGYWVFEEDEASMPDFLSTLDLLRMRLPEGHKDHYHPYWYGPLEGKTTPKSKKAEAA